MTLKTKYILKMERMRRNLRQVDVANYLNMATGSYAKYETGANTPTVENIIKLAELYQVTTDYLLGVGFTAVMKKSFKDGKEWGEEKGEIIADNIEQALSERKRVRKKKTTTN